MNTRVKHVLWDWNGTLLDDIELSVASINNVLRKYNKAEISLDTYHKQFDFPVRDYYERIGFDFNETPFEVVGTEFIEEYYTHWQECQLSRHANKVLNEIQAANITQSILSAADAQRLDMCVQHFEIQNFFTELTGLDHHYAHGKTDIARSFMQRSGLDPETVLFIGDTTHDFEVAQEIGVKCVLFTNGHHPLERLQGCNTPMIDSLEKVLDII